MLTFETKKLPITQLHRNNGQVPGLPRNPRVIKDSNFQKLKASIQEDPEMLELREIIALRTDKDKYVIIGGNMRFEALKALNIETATCKVITGSPDLEQLKRIILKDNSAFGQWDFDILANEFDETMIAAAAIDIPDLMEEAKSAMEQEAEEKMGAIEERWIIPPFSILDTRQGRWQERKKIWEDLGIESEEGRENDLCFDKSAIPPAIYQLRNEMRNANNGIDLTWDEIHAEAKRRGMNIIKTTSIFDPVLCELAYKWFCPTHGRILDPFAGGSVRGIVASALGYEYHGNDLRKEQIVANRKQAKQIFTFSEPHKMPAWYNGDSAEIKSILSQKNQTAPFDMIFSCPPYADLEVYSKDPKDISNMPYNKFLDIYRKIISESVALLKPNSFIVWVVSEIRDKKGNYINFVGDTIKAFQDAGANYYNHFVLINCVSSLAIRIQRQFASTRKNGRTHQNVLVFKKIEEGRGEISGDDFLDAYTDDVISDFKKNRHQGEIHDEVFVFVKGDGTKTGKTLGPIMSGDDLTTIKTEDNAN